MGVYPVRSSSVSNGIYLGSMKIVTLNIWDLPLWFVPDRKERISHISVYLKELDADIICLQESFDPHHRGVLNSLLSAYQTSDPHLDQRSVFFLSFDTTGGLITFSKFPIVTSTFIPFSRFFLPPIEFLGRKGILIVLLDTPYGKLRVINTHIYQGWLFNKMIRMSQIGTMFSQIRTHGSMPTMIAGDFNIDNLFFDKEFLEHMARNNFTHPFIKTVDPTYRKANPYVNMGMNRITHSKRLDYILYNDLSSLHLKIGRYDVLYTDTLISDHDPVVLEMEAE